MSEQEAKSCHRAHNDSGTGFDVEPDREPGNINFIRAIGAGCPIAGYANDGGSNHDDG